MSEPPKRILVLCPTARDRVHFSRPEIRAAYDLEFRGTDEETHAAGFDRGRTDSLVRAPPRGRDVFWCGLAVLPFRALARTGSRAH